jgi:hypothetical protein
MNGGVTSKIIRRKKCQEGQVENNGVCVPAATPLTPPPSLPPPSLPPPSLPQSSISVSAPINSMQSQNNTLNSIMPNLQSIQSIEPSLQSMSPSSMSLQASNENLGTLDNVASVETESPIKRKILRRKTIKKCLPGYEVNNDECVKIMNTIKQRRKKPKQETLENELQIEQQTLDQSLPSSSAAIDSITETNTMDTLPQESIADNKIEDIDTDLQDTIANNEIEDMNTDAQDTIANNEIEDMDTDAQDTIADNEIEDMDTDAQDTIADNEIEDMNTDAQDTIANNEIEDMDTDAQDTIADNEIEDMDTDAQDTIADNEIEDQLLDKEPMDQSVDQQIDVDQTFDETLDLDKTLDLDETLDVDETPEEMPEETPKIIRRSKKEKTEKEKSKSKKKKSTSKKRKGDKDDIDETIEHEEPEEPSNEYDLLYPHLDDPSFSYKIAKMAEFANYSYEADISNIEERANALCKAKFELMPHQIFIKNFLSANTPYRGLLLYNMLGSGKTCTAIGVAEEMRQYMKKVGLKDKILVVASPNVQSNFKLQLFDERKLKQIVNPSNPNEYIWNIESCIGSSLLKEINPDSLHALPRKTVITNINTLISHTYAFMGYMQLGKFIEFSIKRNVHLAETEKDMKEMEIRNIMKVFNNRLIIIDEIHNIRLSPDNKNKTVASLLMKVAKHATGLRLLLLSATPMFNSYNEIIWLTNLLNLNDKRSTISVNDVFDSNGNFHGEDEKENGKKDSKKGNKKGDKKKDADKKESGRDLLARKLNGYVSYVRGENPYLFPFRIYPDSFAPDHVFSTHVSSTTTPPTSHIGLTYPDTQMNGKQITAPLQYVKVYCNKMEENTYQYNVYNYIIQSMKHRPYDFIESDVLNRANADGVPPSTTEYSIFENMEKFGYMILQTPLEALNMCYPNPEMENILIHHNVNESNISLSVNESAASKSQSSINKMGKNKTTIQESIGKRGLSTVMNYRISEAPVSLKSNFDYKPHVLANYGRIFHKDHLYKYSHKIAAICDYIQKTEGIILLYSQFINGGVIPLALALEEMGFARYSSETNQSLFKKPPVEPVDYLMRKKSELDKNETFNQAKYIMITGDKGLSLNNSADVKYATNTENANGSRVKVIIISKTGSESIDFKNIRQIHILEPWYNMNRMEQIVGRGVRNLSHCSLPFLKRNVQIFYHCTLLDKKETEECADLYVYRLAESKAVQIGNVTRLLKEVAVDCVLNIGQTRLTAENLMKVEENKHIKQQLGSEGRIIEFRVGDKPFTEVCDYMDTCEYSCRVNKEVDMDNLNYALYNTDYAKMNIQHIATRIKQLFKEKYVYTRENIVSIINYQKNYPIDEIFFTLKYFLDQQDTLVDQYGRLGYLVNRSNYYLFQPIELTNETAMMNERMIPVEYKRKQLEMEIPDVFMEDYKQINLDDDDMDFNNKPQNTVKVNMSKTAKDIINAIFKQFKVAVTPVKEISAKDKDWFKHCSTVYEHLKLVHNINEKDLKKYIVYHAVDILKEEDKIILLNELYSENILRSISGNNDWIFSLMSEEETKDELYFAVVTNIQAYFDSKIRVLDNGKMGVFISGDSNISLYVKDAKSKWEKGDEDDIRTFLDPAVLVSTQTRQSTANQEENNEFVNTKVDPKHMYHLVGFIADFKKGECVFKVKNILQKRNNTGAKCDNAGKLDIIRFLNDVVDVDNMYTPTNVIDIKQPGLCVMLELIMREYTRIGKNGGKVYFMDTETAILSGVAGL